MRCEDCESELNPSILDMRIGEVFCSQCFTASPIETKDAIIYLLEQIDHLQDQVDELRRRVV